MKGWLGVAVLACAVVLLSNGNVGLAEKHHYYPAVGDEAVVYSHKFKAEFYHAGKDLVVEGFSAAMKASGQVRRTFFLANPGTHEVMAVSFFKAGESVDEWHDFAKRFEVLHKLEPMRRAPLGLQRLRVIGENVAP